MDEIIHALCRDFKLRYQEWSYRYDGGSTSYYKRKLRYNAQEYTCVVGVQNNTRFAVSIDGEKQEFSLDTEIVLHDTFFSDSLNKELFWYLDN